MELGDRRMETEGRSGALACIQRRARGCVGVAQGETGPCPRRDPLACSYHCYWPLVVRWLRRGGRRHCCGVRLTRGAKWQRQQGKRGGARAWATRAGLLAGSLRASWASLMRAGRAACLATARWRAEKASRPGLRGLLLFSFLFCFLFLLP